MSYKTDSDRAEEDIRGLLPQKASADQEKVDTKSFKAWWKQKHEQFWVWAEAARWGDRGSNVDYFRFPEAIIYVMVQTANLFMSLYVLLFLHAANENCFHLWVGLWMLSTTMVLWCIMNELVYTTFFTFVVIFHSSSELTLSLYSIDALDLAERNKSIVLLLTFLFMVETHLILHCSINVQVTLNIVIGDGMHYIALPLVLVGAMTNESPHYWWIVASMTAHHTYDMMIYLVMLDVMPRAFEVKQYWATVWNTVSIVLGFICCLSTCDKPSASILHGWRE